MAQSPIDPSKKAGLSNPSCSPDRRPGRTSKAGSSSPITHAGELPQGSKYPFSTVYLLGRSYPYSGPDRDKRYSVEDPTLIHLDFRGVEKLVVEIDSFVAEIEQNEKILSVVDRLIGSVFSRNKLSVLFRRIPGLPYPEKTERRIHKLVVEIRKRGYRIVDNVVDEM